MCLAATTELRLSIRHLSLQDSALTCLSVRSLPLILANIGNSSDHLKWAQDNVRNHVGVPSCFTIAITSCMNISQYGDVSCICLWNKYAWSSQVRFKDWFLIEKEWQLAHELSLEQYLYYLILSFVQLWIVKTGSLFLLVLCYRLHFLFSTIIINILWITRSGLLYFYWHYYIIMFMDIGDDNFF